MKFAIYGTFDPDEATQTLGLQPSRKARRGERVNDGRRVIPVEDIWELSSDLTAETDTTSMVQEMVDRLEEVRPQLSRIRERFPEANFDLKVIAYVPTDGEQPIAPTLRLKPGVLSSLGSLGVHFGVDITLLVPGED